MFKRLIIPLDGSRLSEAVLPTAVFLAQKLGATLTLVHVIERNAPKRVHGERHLSKPAEAEAYIAEVRQRIIPGGIPVEMHVHTVAIADVARSIVDHAREFESDLVMMCTHGRGGLRKLLFGSIAQQVVALKAPVLLVRPAEDGGAPIPTGKPFLLPLDGTPIREAALPVAAALAQACGALLKLLVVVPTFETFSGVENPSRILLPATTQEMLALAYEDAREYAAALVARLAGQGVEASVEVRRGDASEIIAREAQSLDVDWIVLGTAARTGMDAFWSGSLAPKVSERTHLPLLLIPPKDS